MGADLVHVLTTENAAPVIKIYSPDLIVYPFLEHRHFQKIRLLLMKMDVVIIGPGLGRENETITLTSEIIEYCKLSSIPLIVDADGLYVISKKPFIINNYPSPGAILTPNFSELKRLRNSSTENDWGPYVSILEKGKNDRFISSDYNYNWSFNLGGSGRRVGGQGDILSGILATYFNWVLKCKICEDNKSNLRAASVASFVAAKVTRMCNENTYRTLGRSMVASDMLQNIHIAFDILFHN